MKAFKGINHGKRKIEFSDKPLIEMIPTEIHLKEDGDTDDNPSMAIVMGNKFGHLVYGQLSLKMWNEGLADIGYKIVNYE